MYNIIDYVNWRGDLKFSESPVNLVDVIVFSQIAMPDLSKCITKRGCTVKQCAEKFVRSGERDKKLGLIIPGSINTLLVKMADTARFGGLMLSRYIADIDIPSEVQFSALTIDAPDINTRFVVFSGTDDTIVGWKENFNLIFKTPTIAQLEAVKYLESAARGFDGKIIVLGHSKGGHLALYSTINCTEKVYSKILKTVNLDGPGIPDNEQELMRYHAAEKKIVSILPQSSIIGRLFEHGEEFIIVHSENKGLYQHDCFSWAVSRTDIVREDEFSEIGTGIDSGVREILSGMDAFEREEFVEGLFGMFYATSSTTLTELAANGRNLVKAYFQTNGERRKIVNKTLTKILANKYLRRCVIETSRQSRAAIKEGNKDLSEPADK